MAEPIEASSLYSDAPLFRFGVGVQFDVDDILRPVHAWDFPEMSSLESVVCMLQFFCEGSQFADVKPCNTGIECSDFDCVAAFCCQEMYSMF